MHYSFILFMIWSIFWSGTFFDFATSHEQINLKGLIIGIIAGPVCWIWLLCWLSGPLVRWMKK